MKNGKTLKEGVLHECPVQEEKGFEKKALSSARGTDMTSNSTISACCIEERGQAPNWMGGKVCKEAYWLNRKLTKVQKRPRQEVE